MNRNVWLCDISEPLFFAYLFLTYMLSCSVRLLWYLLVKDVRHTLRKVCRMVCNDESVDPETRMKRAKALLELGKIYVMHTSDTSIDDSVQDLFTKFGILEHGLGRMFTEAWKRQNEANGQEKPGGGVPSFFST